MDHFVTRHELRGMDGYILVALAKVTVFARFTVFASFTVFAIRIAVTIFPAGAAGDAAAALGVLLAVGLAAEDLMIDFLEIAMIVTSDSKLNCCTATSNATRVPNMPPANLFLYVVERTGYREWRFNRRVWIAHHG